MQLKLIRFWPNNVCIQGCLYVDEASLCFTIERSYDDPEWKPIPIGGPYPVQIRWSEKFQRNLPHIDNVPGRSAIEIHMGNWAKDSEGCVIVGEIRESDTMIGESERALGVLIAVLQPVQDQGETISITVEDGEEWTAT